MITETQIAHYKSISEASLRFGDVNVIVGPNGSGKSNLLDALYFLHDCASEDIDTAITKRHGIDSLRQWSRTRPYNVVICCSFKNRFGYGSYKLVVASSKGNYKIIEEEGDWVGPNPLVPSRDNSSRFFSQFKRNEEGQIKFNISIGDVQIGKLPEVPQAELFLTMLAGRAIPSELYLIFRHISRELDSFSKYNIYPNTLRSPQVVSKEDWLKEDGSNITTILKRMNSNKRFSRFKDDFLTGLQAIMPNIVDFQVRSAGGFYVPVLRVRESNDDVHDFNLSQISDGTLRMLGLLAAFYQGVAPSKIGVEEPEQMVHPGAMSVIYDAIGSYVDERDRQVFVTTHSPTLLDLFEPKNIIWTRMKNGITECGPIKLRQLEIIKEHLFSAGELLLAEGIF